MSKEWLKNKIVEAWDKIVISWLIWLILSIPILLIGFFIYAIDGYEERYKTINQPYKIGSHWKIHPENGYDKQKLYAKFIFIPFSDKFSWKKGTTKTLVLNGKILNEEEIKKIIFKDLSEIIKRGGGLISIGTSSQEGLQSEEEDRAFQRADQLANWLKSGISSNKGLFSLSLGQHNRIYKNNKNTNYQRPAVIVCILDWDKNVNMSQALANAMLKQRDLPNPDNYSAFVFRVKQNISSPPFSFKTSIAKILKEISDNFKIFQ